MMVDRIFFDPVSRTIFCPETDSILKFDSEEQLMEFIKDHAEIHSRGRDTTRNEIHNESRHCIVCGTDTNHTVELVWERWMDENIPDEELYPAEVIARKKRDTTTFIKCQKCHYLVEEFSVDK